MNRFIPTDGNQAILFSRGLFKPAKIYLRETDNEKHVYAQHGSGYIRLMKNGATSVSNISWIDTDMSYAFGKHGRMITD